VFFLFTLIVYYCIIFIVGEFMKDSKGFTLAELLGVLTLLAIIALITVPLVNKYIANSRQKAYDAEMSTLKKAAQQWFVKNSASVQWDEYGYYALDLDTLKQSEFLSDEAIYNPLNPDEQITGCIMINNNNGIYSYEYSATCSVEFPVYANGTAVYFNPVTGSTCTSSEAVSTTGTKMGCMKWYTFNDAGDSSPTINLILDHNTTAVVAWNSTGSTVSGPTNVLTQLQADTSAWTGVSTRTDSYSLSNGTSTYTINYSTYKARLITAAEIAAITGNSSFIESTAPYTSWFYFDSNNQTRTATTTGASNYYWLFDYTSGCTSYGCNIADASNNGYWTSTANVSNTSYDWIVSNTGFLGNCTVGDNNVFGVRPVITLPKSTL
jgi:prepilin-type N-terminal cleavage/methylation domain-containing protein